MSNNLAWCYGDDRTALEMATNQIVGARRIVQARLDDAIANGDTDAALAAFNARLDIEAEADRRGVPA